MPQHSLLHFRACRLPQKKLLLLAAAIMTLGVILVCTLWPSRGIEPTLQHQVESIRWALDNVRGAFAPDSSCQPACRSMLLRWLKRAAVVVERYLALR